MTLSPNKIIIQLQNHSNTPCYLQETMGIPRYFSEVEERHTYFSYYHRMEKTLHLHNHTTLVNKMVKKLCYYENIVLHLSYLNSRGLVIVMTVVLNVFEL